MKNMQYLVYLLSCLCIVCFMGPVRGSAPTVCITIQPDTDTISVCAGSPVVLTVAGGSQYSWSPAADFDDPTADTVTLTPSASQWYYVTGMGPDSVCADSIYVLLPEFSVSQPSPIAICPLDVVNVTFSSNVSIDSVHWSNPEGVLDTANTAGSAVTPLITADYVITAYLGDCILTDTFTINVIDFRFQLLMEDTVYLCLDDSIQITHALFPVTADIVWTPLDSTIRVVGPGSAYVKPEVSTTYMATATDGDCMLSTTIFVRVDSLPDTLLTVIPLKDPYCAGETVTIFAERADTLKYPDISFDWFPKDGQIQDSTNTGNVFVILQDTTTFFRIMRNNACLDSSVLTLNVIPPDLPLSVTDTTLCPGDMFQVEILDPDVTDIEWMPTTGLSCSDCLNPTVEVFGNQVYMVTAEKDRCTVSGMLTVRVYPPYDIPVVPPFASACPGDTIPFTVDLTGLTNVNLSVSGNGSVSCSNCPNPVVTYGGGVVRLQITADETFEMFCGALGTVEIAMKPDTVAVPVFIETCANEPLTIPLAGYNFINPTLSLSSGDLSCSNCLNPVVTVNSNATLTVTSDSPSPNACRMTTRFNLGLYPPDDVNFSFDRDPPFGEGEVVGVTLVTTPQPPAGSMFNWTVNGMQLTGNTATINIPLNEAENMIHVSWTNSHGCMQEADTIVTTVPPYYEIPNVFTPNRELNTRFRVNIVGNLELIQMLVFNRWGQVVYEGSDDDGWDGRRNGEPAPPEVYTYLIKMRAPSGKITQEKGDVTLIR